MRIVQTWISAGSQQLNICTRHWLIVKRQPLKTCQCPAAFCNPETLKVLDSFEAGSDNMILAGHPKNGTNWLEQVINDLEITAAKYTEEEINERINIRNEFSVFPCPESGDPEKFKIQRIIPDG
nr:sulfotransferase 6B1-like isoform X2 [Pelodiscus sinensis]|eukprot:XP_025039840.1 sulfotransferase 6B1-like isoform X2 [Pelodiscus sinensis]